jgi:hypothetical protein
MKALLAAADRCWLLLLAEYVLKQHKQHII